LRVLDAVGGNKSRAAHVLGVDRKTLYKMIDPGTVNTGETVG
jgi:DNA-binding protein Fis